MGRVVTFAQLTSETVNGIDAAPITRGDTQEMAAEHIRIAPRRQWSATATRGADCYLFVLDGASTISAAGRQYHFPPEAFAAVEEGVAFRIEAGEDGPASIIKVIAPPQPNGRPAPGFTGKIAVVERADAPMLDLPHEKKKRIYFVDDDAIKSERGHAMIVVYEKDTVTRLHHHPNAESMFVMLSGALQFIINGEAAVLRPGQAVYFGLNDLHGLRVAQEQSGATFLEFHIPAAYSTVRSQE